MRAVKPEEVVMSLAGSPLYIDPLATARSRGKKAATGVVPGVYFITIHFC
jgi:hypothetical protein